MKKYLLAIILMLPALALAAPFLVCDPSTVDGSEPTAFVVTLNGTTYAAPAVATGTNQVYLHLDLSGKVAANNTATVKAQNVWGDSAQSAPFVFKAGAPAAPGGLKYSAQ